jgi:hypothetical protein
MTLEEFVNLYTPEHASDRGREVFEERLASLLAAARAEERDHLIGTFRDLEVETRTDLLADTEVTSLLTRARRFQADAAQWASEWIQRDGARRESLKVQP